MALRAYIDRRIGKADDAVNRRGDVISVHIADARALPDENGECFKLFAIIENWPDAALEADMRAKRETIRAYPYEQVETRVLLDGKGVPIRKLRRVLQRSARVVDFASWPVAGERTTLTQRAKLLPRTATGVTVNTRTAPVVRGGWNLEGTK